MVDY
jgi:hypothetical protein